MFNFSCPKEVIKLTVKRNMFGQRVCDHVSSVNPYRVPDPTLESAFSQTHDDESLCPVLWDTFLSSLKLEQVEAVRDHVHW